MGPASELGLALVEALDDSALERLAERLEPVLAARAERAEPAEPNSDRWLDARQAAAHLGLSVTALHKLTAARLIPFEQECAGCRLWFRRSELDRWRLEGGSRRHRGASSSLPRMRRAAS
jgi:hypothetical protein